MRRRKARNAKKISNTEYDITVNLQPNLQYKFLTTLNYWQPQYGVITSSSPDAKNGGNIGYNFGLPGQSDPDAIPTPDIPGTYNINLNFKTGKIYRY